MASAPDLPPATRWLHLWLSNGPERERRGVAAGAILAGPQRSPGMPHGHRHPSAGTKTPWAAVPGRKDELGLGFELLSFARGGTAAANPEGRGYILTTCDGHRLHLRNATLDGFVEAGLVAWDGEAAYRVTDEGRRRAAGRDPPAARSGPSRCRPVRSLRAVSSPGPNKMGHAMMGDAGMTEGDAMAEIDRTIGAAGGSEQDLALSIGAILTTPLGTRATQRDFGFEALDEDGDPKAGLTPDEVEASALRALSRWEPRAIVETVGLDYDGDALLSIHIRFRGRDGGASRGTTVRYE